jgi:hypothetical protein
MKKRPNRRKLAQFLGQQKLDAVTRTPAILYFPPEVLERLNALCVEFQCSPLEPIMEAFKPQHDRWEEFVEEVMAPLKSWETEVLAGRSDVCLGLRQHDPDYAESHRNHERSRRVRGPEKARSLAMGFPIN